MTILFTIIISILVGFIDFEIVTPLLPIPDDICYYHNNTPPKWIELFYLDSSGHTEFPYSGLHLLFIFIFSMVCGVFLAIKIDKYLMKRQVK